MEAKITLSVPVSVNELTFNKVNGGARGKTRKAKEWEARSVHEVLTFINKHRAICDYNLLTRLKYRRGRKSIDLRGMLKDHPSLSYKVVYKYFFSSSRESLPRDVFNFEKQLTDFLVTMGFMLDDSFIDDGRVVRLPEDSKSPRVEINIKTLDIFV